MSGDLMEGRARGGSTLRPYLGRVQLSSTTWQSSAEVTLSDGSGEVVGRASSPKTPLSLKVVAEATVDAIKKLRRQNGLVLKGASLAQVVGEESVIVIVSDQSCEMIGAALVKDGPIAHAAVKATLDALNRRLTGGPH